MTLHEKVFSRSLNLLGVSEDKSYIPSYINAGKDAEVFDISNVAYYTHTITGRDKWDTPDISNFAPPYPVCWFEYDVPELEKLEDEFFPNPLLDIADRIGVLVEFEDAQSYEHRWTARASFIAWKPSLGESFLVKGLLAEMDEEGLVTEKELEETFQNSVVLLPGITTFFINADGYPAYHQFSYTEEGIPMLGGVEETANGILANLSLPALLAVNFLHARGTEVKEIIPIKKRRYRKRKSNPLQTPTNYRYLNIPSLQRVYLKRNQFSLSNPPSYHGVRGHFRRYTEEAPLLGHYVGTVWVDPFARGRKKGDEDKKPYKFGKVKQEDVDNLRSR